MNSLQESEARFITYHNYSTTLNPETNYHNYSTTLNNYSTTLNPETN